MAKEVEIDSEFVLNEPEPFVNFIGFSDSSLDFELYVWISNPETKSDLNFRIYDQLKEQEIEIPFPQRDLLVRSIDADVVSRIRE